ncbi:hypothetical protein BD626DRAFT_506781 [Schizophyllum amplum]|uniref:Uncharacterized protein n=1 Tax=Schizophyllum amplum TaxID=97359 RepID=A0A550C528_9AGAR|nr:hypothetical protein BD626DRAFT_506781 [Auriculariopsis ampla]
MNPCVQDLLNRRPTVPDDISLQDTIYLNAPLRDTKQKEQIVRLLDDMQAYERDLDGKLNDLRATLDLIYQAKKEVSDGSERLRQATASPIRALPADIICDIIELCIDFEPFWSLPMSVCRGWRAAAHALPRLWHQLRLTGWCIMKSGRTSLAEHWFSRSGLFPSPTPFGWTHMLSNADVERGDDLDLHGRRGFHRIHDDGSFEEGAAKADVVADESYAQHMVQLLGNQLRFPARRLRTYALSPRRAMQHLHWLPFPRTPSPAGESASPLSGHDPKPPDAPIVAFARSPLLRRLNLTVMAEFQFEPHQNLRRILRECIHLVDTHINEDGLISAEREVLGDEDAILATPVTLDNLRSLRFDEGSICATALDLPNLTALELDRICWRRSADLGAAFIARSPRLESLTLRRVSFQESAAYLLQLMRLLPQLQSLTLDDCTIDDCGLLYDTLTVKPGEDMLLPGLQELRLIRQLPRTGRVHDAKEGFVAMVKSRVRRRSLGAESCVLRRIVVWPIGNRLSFYYRNTMREMEKDGLLLCFDLDDGEYVGRPSRGDCDYLYQDQYW